MVKISDYAEINTKLTVGKSSRNRIIIRIYWKCLIQLVKGNITALNLTNRY